MNKKSLKTAIGSVVSAVLAAACSTTATDPVAAPAVPPTSSAPVYVLDDILGAAPGDVDALLGAPALIRREGAGEYRRYALSTCTLIVILYPDETGAVSASHLDAAAKNTSEAKPDLAACLAAG